MAFITILLQDSFTKNTTLFIDDKEELPVIKSSGPLVLCPPPNSPTTTKIPAFTHLHAADNEIRSISTITARSVYLTA